ncbi:unnamed protein product [Cunninghamella blakesleeana]
MAAILKVNKRILILLCSIGAFLFILLLQQLQYKVIPSRSFRPPPLPITDLEQYWPAPIEDAFCLPKIYVYEAPSTFQVPAEVRDGLCHESNYNISNPTSTIHKKYVTKDPEEADYFFIPFFGSCYLYHCWSKSGWKWDERCDVDEKYVKPMMKMIVEEYPYWNQSATHPGKNHIMIHPMDKTFTYYENHSLFLNATFLTTVGDKRRIWTSRHRFHRDIVIPSATRIIHHLKVDINHYLDPTTGQPLHHKKRNIFLLFHGCCEDTKSTDLYSNGIRSLLFQYFKHYPGYDIGGNIADLEYIEKLARSKYGLAPMGWTLDTTRIWEFMAFGVVPVVIADGIIEPFEMDVDWDSFIVRIRREEAHRLDEILRNIDDDTYEFKRKRLWEHGRRVGLEMDAWHFIVRELCRMSETFESTNLHLGY